MYCNRGAQRGSSERFINARNYYEDRSSVTRVQNQPSFKACYPPEQCQRPSWKHSTGKYPLKLSNGSQQESHPENPKFRSEGHEIRAYRGNDQGSQPFSFRKNASPRSNDIKHETMKFGHQVSYRDCYSDYPSRNNWSYLKDTYSRQSSRKNTYPDRRYSNQPRNSHAYNEYYNENRNKYSWAENPRKRYEGRKSAPTRSKWNNNNYYRFTEQRKDFTKQSHQLRPYENYECDYSYSKYEPRQNRNKSSYPTKPISCYAPFRRETKSFGPEYLGPKNYDSRRSVGVPTKYCHETDINTHPERMQFTKKSSGQKRSVNIPCNASINKRQSTSVVPAYTHGNEFYHPSITSDIPMSYKLYGTPLPPNGPQTYPIYTVRDNFSVNTGHQGYHDWNYYTMGAAGHHAPYDMQYLNSCGRDQINVAPYNYPTYNGNSFEEYHVLKTKSANDPQVTGSYSYIRKVVQNPETEEQSLVPLSSLTNAFTTASSSTSDFQNDTTTSKAGSKNISSYKMRPIKARQNMCSTNYKKDTSWTTNSRSESSCNKETKSMLINLESCATVAKHQQADYQLPEIHRSGNNESSSTQEHSQTSKQRLEPKCSSSPDNQSDEIQLTNKLPLEHSEHSNHSDSSTACSFPKTIKYSDVKKELQCLILNVQSSHTKNKDSTGTNSDSSSTNNESITDFDKVKVCDCISEVLELNYHEMGKEVPLIPKFNKVSQLDLKDKQLERLLNDLPDKIIESDSKDIISNNEVIFQRKSDDDNDTNSINTTECIHSTENIIKTEDKDNETDINPDVKDLFNDTSPFESNMNKKTLDFSDICNESNSPLYDEILDIEISQLLPSISLEDEAKTAKSPTDTVSEQQDKEISTSDTNTYHVDTPFTLRCINKVPRTQPSEKFERQHMVASPILNDFTAVQRRRDPHIRDTDFKSEENPKRTLEVWLRENKEETD